MPRPRKIAAEQSKHLTAAERAKKERETELAAEDAALICTSKSRRVKNVLLDAVAAEKWDYVVKIKRASKTLANADFDNLVVYCNAWSNYMKSISLQSQFPGDPEMMTVALKMEKQATDLIYRYGARLGLDLNSRLKTAAVKVEKEQNAIEDKFGEI